LCQNCGRVWSLGEIEPDIDNFEMRVGAGEICPAGECPECGALCHEVKRYIFQNNDGTETFEFEEIHEGLAALDLLRRLGWGCVETRDLVVESDEEVIKKARLASANALGCEDVVGPLGSCEDDALVSLLDVLCLYEGNSEADLQRLEGEKSMVFEAAGGRGVHAADELAGIRAALAVEKAVGLNRAIQSLRRELSPS